MTIPSIDILHKVVAVAKEAGSFIRKESESFDRDAVEHKGFNDLVSYVDKTAEKIIVEGLKGVLPGAGFIAEEGTGEQNPEGPNWIIDPLDGTTNFVHGIPAFAVSIALYDAGELTLGVVYEVIGDECFSALKGSGAWLNDKPIRVSQAARLESGLIATGFPYAKFDHMPQYLDVLTEFMRSTHGVRRIGSAAIDLAYTACGRFEGFFEYGLKPWDVAAGILLVKEAGGELSDFTGGDQYLFGGQIVAANALHNDILSVIRKQWPEDETRMKS
ncbi:inositol monophosphatase family protein [Roseivirga sp. BDSF3-8]|uniref:inositol monophosphatase family protein n=1 Tax=Roseivirga sp. BDSF3-8 TaxID=3241598 RepID=UPI003531E70C